MSDKEQIEHFEKDLDNLVVRYRVEYEIAYASVVGVLRLKSYELEKEAYDQRDEE